MTTAPVRRGTSNTNDRGNVTNRRRRREWLVDRFRANVDLAVVEVYLVGPTLREVPRGEGEAACRCYRCGCLLTADTVTSDRIVPGCEGGTYVRTNVRPACSPCQSETGGVLGAQRKRRLQSVPAQP